MRITPIVNHACARLPQLTDMFSDVLQADIVAAPGGNTTINCQSAHNQETGSKIAVCVRGAKTRIEISNAEISGLSSNYALITTTTPHGLVDNATAIGVNSWNAEIELTGFDDPLMNAVQTFVSKINDTAFLIEMPEGAALDISGTAYLIDDRNDFINGWHPVEVIDETTLQMPTNPALDYATIAENVTVAFNIRAWGAIDFEIIKSKYTGEQAQLRQASIAISPLPTVSISKDRGAKTSAVAELNGSTVVRQMMLDGFHVTVVVPTTDTFGALSAIDLCHGELLNAILKTFQGYQAPQPDLTDVQRFSAVLKNHGGFAFDRAFYAHNYEFESPFILNNSDALKGTEQTIGGQIESIDPNDVTPAQPIGSVPISDLNFEGIYNGDFDEPLTASVTYED